MEGRSPNKKQEGHDGPFRRTNHNKDRRLRENYIVPQDDYYDKLKEEMQELISSSQFNRFISLKKYNFQGN
jgi:hypothetical protein